MTKAGLFFQPPVAAPEELVSLRDPAFSYPMFEQMRDRAHMLRGVFAWHPRTLHADGPGEPEPTSMVLVTGGFHDTLGLQPAAGRLLNHADVGNTAAEAQPVAVLSYACWQRRFNGDPAAIGRTLRIEGQPFTIVGITPRGFFGVAVGLSPDVTIPVTMLPRLRSDEECDETTSGHPRMGESPCLFGPGSSPTICYNQPHISSENPCANRHRISSLSSSRRPPGRSHLHNQAGSQCTGKS